MTPPPDPHVVALDHPRGDGQAPAPVTPPPDRHVVALLIVLAVGLALGRIIGSEYLYEPSVHRPDGSSIPRPKWASPKPQGQPTFGSNDRSRWAAIRALVDHGTFVIGKRER